MQNYLNLMRQIYEEGLDRQDRTGTGTRGLFGHQLRFDLRQGFPLLTTKKVHFKSVVHELLWFLKGEGNIQYLQENGVRIWNEWADPSGNLGPVYGVQWRRWKTVEGKEVDQIATVIDEIRKNPSSRRLIVSAWNVGELPQMALPPCHAFFQFQVSGKYLNCQLYQRSADIFLGVPFNIACYSLLTHMMAAVTGLEAGDFVLSLGDVHLYNNHFEQAQIQLSRKPKPLPRLIIHRKTDNIDDFVYEDFELLEYDPHPLIKAQVSV